MLDILTEIYRFIYDGCLSVTGSYGWSLALMSFVTAFLVEPFKKLTEQAQKKEHLHRAILEPKLAAIRGGFSGAERHERIAKLYRKYSYHPLYSLRALFGVMLQVPLLYAAFTMLSNHKGLIGIPFLAIADLSKPDALLGSINLLPFLMTGLNLVALAYTRDFRRSDYIQGVVIAGAFLVLLYPAPSALLVYWTVNNAIFAFRSVYARFHRKAVTVRVGHRADVPPLLPPIIGEMYAWIPAAGLVATCFASAIRLYFPPDSIGFSSEAYWSVAQFAMCVAMTYLVSQPRAGAFSSRDLALFLLLTASYPLFLKYGALWCMYCLFGCVWFFRCPVTPALPREAAILLIPWLFSVCRELLEIGWRPFLFYWPYLALLVVQWLKYRYRERNSPTGFFDIWNRLFPGKTGAYYIVSMTALGVLLVVFSPCALYASSHLDFGGITGLSVFAVQCGMLVFLLAFSYILWSWLREEWRPWVTLAACLITIASFFQATVLANNYGALDLSRFKIAPNSLNMPIWKDGAALGIAALALFLCAFVKRGRLIHRMMWIMTIGMFLFCIQLLFIRPQEKTGFAGAYTLSGSSPNTLLIMLDTFTAEHVRDALEEEPGLHEVFRGFTWFEDTLANGECTLFSVPAMLGGIEYAPEGMNMTPERSRLDKTLEAFARLPNQFTENGARVAMSDPCIWIMMPESSAMLREYLTHPKSVSIINTLDCQDSFVRSFLAASGNSDVSDIDRRTMSSFLLAISLFRVAPQITKLSFYDDGKWLHTPDEVMKLRIYNVSKQVAMMANLSDAFAIDQGPPTLNMYFNNMMHRPYLLGRDSLKIRTTVQPQYYSAIHALKMLGDFLDWMRQNRVFDNTLIIVASDHSGFLNEFPKRITDPDIQRDWEAYRPNALLMVKPFDSNTPFSVSDAQMAVSDIYDIAGGRRHLSDYADRSADSSPRTRLVHSGIWHWTSHPANTLNVRTSAVTGSQFEASNWRRIEEK